jgi:hypothetical protein
MTIRYAELMGEITGLPPLRVAEMSALLECRDVCSLT